VKFSTAARLRDLLDLYSSSPAIIVFRELTLSCAHCIANRRDAANVSRYSGDGHIRPTSGLIASMIYEPRQESVRLESRGCLRSQGIASDRTRKVQFAAILRKSVENMFIFLPRHTFAKYVSRAETRRGIPVIDSRAFRGSCSDLRSRRKERRESRLHGGDNLSWEPISRSCQIKRELGANFINSPANWIRRRKKTRLTKDRRTNEIRKSRREIG